MSFRIDNFVIDRVLRAYMLNSDDELIGYLDNLTDASIELSSESTDVTDARGVLIKRFYRAKTASLTANNAIFSLSTAALQLGSEKIEATDEDAIVMPMSTIVKAGKTVDLKGFVTGSVKVYGLTNSGSATKEYEADTTADATHYAITTGGVLTPPTATDETQYFVYYKKSVKSGVQYLNSADKFPQSVRIRIEVLGYDTCHVTDSEPQVLIISGDSFNISPDTTITLGGDSQELSFSGEFSADYCSEDKGLFSIYAADDDE